VVVFRTTVGRQGLDVPTRAVDELGAGTQVPVRVSVNEETYSATVRRRGDGFVVRMGEGHRAAAGVEVGDDVEVTLVLEPGRRHVDLPADLAAALDRAGARQAFEELPWSHRKEHALAVTGARHQATRERRITRIVAKVST
jgi:hypothetical protein